jgi:hypothetical protein
VTYPVGKKAGHLNTFLKNICKSIRNCENYFVSLHSCSEVGSIYGVSKHSRKCSTKNKHEKRLGILKIISYLYKNQKQVLKSSLNY